MKKFVSLIIVMALFVIPMAHAEDTFALDEMSLSELTSLYGKVVTELGRRAIPTTEENHANSTSSIVFRSVPWGISATKFQAAMTEQSISGSINEAYSSESWEFEPDSGTIKPIDKLEDSGFVFRSYSPEITVAGFKISKVEASFLYTFDENTLFTDQEHSSLYKAKYEFDIVDGEASYTVLATKLAALYGDGTKGHNSTGYWSTGGDYHVFTDWTVWYGADDTATILWHEFETYDSNGTTKSDAVYLLYGCSNSLKQLSDLKSAMAREELKNALESTDTDGL